VINAIIERKGAVTGLITTRGFRDVLELGRELRYDAYDIFAEYPQPLVPRRLRLEVNERVTSDGRVIQELETHEVRRALVELRGAGVESLAICLINSYRNPVHEKQIKALVEQEWPEVFLSTSVEVLPQIREYERTCTTATNAYVKPITARYLKKLSARLESEGFKGKLYIMLSSGGITSVETAREFPVRIIESGPTAAASLPSITAACLISRISSASTWEEPPPNRALFKRARPGWCPLSKWAASSVSRKAAACPFRCPWWI
jgi:N-methylhydantoinase A